MEDLRFRSRANTASRLVFFFFLTDECSYLLSAARRPFPRHSPDARPFCLGGFNAFLIAKETAAPPHHFCFYMEINGIDGALRVHGHGPRRSRRVEGSNEGDQYAANEASEQRGHVRAKKHVV